MMAGPINWLSQVASVSKFGLLSIPQRRGSVAAAVFGIAGVVNGISGVHQAFLNAGGLGILVGDGKLPHPGDEPVHQPEPRTRHTPGGGRGLLTGLPRAQFFAASGWGYPQAALQSPRTPTMLCVSTHQTFKRRQRKISNGCNEVVLARRSSGTARYTSHSGDR